jgi:SAM-dependent methyltransferase
MGRTEEALRTLEPFLTRDPRDVDALTLAGEISALMKQPDDAAAFYRAALAVDPFNPDLAAKAAAASTSGPAPSAAMSARFDLLATHPAHVAPPTAPAPAVAPAGLRVLEYDPRASQALPDGWYDAVTCKTPFDRLIDPVGALREMTRILKPGGKLWIDLGVRLEITKAASGASSASPGASATAGANPVWPAINTYAG